MNGFIDPDWLSAININGAFKIFAVFIMGLYVLFSAIVVRQVFLLSSTLDTDVSPLLRLGAVLSLICMLLLLYGFVVFL